MPVQVMVPADREASVLARAEDIGAKRFDWRLLSPEAERREVVEGSDKKVKVVVDEVQEWLNGLAKDDVVLAPMGGTGDSVMIGAHQRGIRVMRVPFYYLSRNGFESTITPPAAIGKSDGKVKERANTAARIIDLYRTDASQFRPYELADARISQIRVIINQLIAIQDELRKPLEQREARLERDRRYLMDPQDPRITGPEVLKWDFLMASDPAEELRRREEELTKHGERILKQMEVYRKVLEPVRGLGPRISLRLLASIVDIRRFKNIGNFISYAGWRPMERNGRYVAWQFTRNATELGIKGACPLLRQAAWLMGEQIVRNNSQLKWHFDGYKLRHADLVGRKVGVDAKGKDLVMSKAWLNKRAKRAAVKAFLIYLYEGMWEMHGREFRPFGQPDGPVHKAADLLNPAAFYPADHWTPIEYDEAEYPRIRSIDAAEESEDNGDTTVTTWKPV